MQRRKLIYGLFAILLLWGCTHFKSSLSQAETVQNQAQILPVGAIAKVGETVIQLEVAKTPEEQAMGLMYRNHLEKDRGMIFLFSPPRMTRFWMKNTWIPLDMIFLRDGVIQSISSQVPPCTSDPCPSYGPLVEIDQVVELASGRAAELGLKRGDRLNIEFTKTR